LRFREARLLIVFLERFQWRSNFGNYFRFWVCRMLGIPRVEPLNVAMTYLARDDGKTAARCAKHLSRSDLDGVIPRSADDVSLDGEEFL
jgi:hypothetical protein